MKNREATRKKRNEQNEKQNSRVAQNEEQKKLKN